MVYVFMVFMALIVIYGVFYDARNTTLRNVISHIFYIARPPPPPLTTPDQDERFFSHVGWRGTLCCCCCCFFSSLSLAFPILLFFYTTTNMTIGEFEGEGETLTNPACSALWGGLFLISGIFFSFLERER